MNTDKDKHHGNQRMIEAQRTQPAAAPETERGHSCPQQRPDAEPFQNFLTPSCHSTLLRTGMSALRSGGPDHRIRERGGFTLIEMLVVIAIIGVLSALLLNLLPRAANMKVRTRVKAELAQLETAIEAYKEKRGHYPPDHPGLPSTNSLYYELVGTALNNASSGNPSYTTLSGDNSILTTDVMAAFGVPGFINANATADDAKNFHPVLKVGQQTTEIQINGHQVKLLSVACKGPNGDFCVWNYNSSTPVHNPNSFDLWVDVLLSGKTNTFGNWKKD